MVSMDGLLQMQTKYYPTAHPALCRHDKTQLIVKQCIASMLRSHAGKMTDLLEIGGNVGWQTVAYRNQLARGRQATIYDWKDYRTQQVKNETQFFTVDLERQPFSAADESFDVVVCNQVFEHLKNIFLPLSEIYRVLRENGLLIFSVPNLSALHNMVLVLIGRQPTTMGISSSHVRGFSIWSTSRFLTEGNKFQIENLKGFGLHPFTSCSLSGPFRTFCHTPVWLLRKLNTKGILWDEKRKNSSTTTNF